MAMPYRSIGKVLIDRGEVKRRRHVDAGYPHWGEAHSAAEVRELLEQNPSFVFFKPENFCASARRRAVPLVAKASVASDRSLDPNGYSLLAEIPGWTIKVNLPANMSCVMMVVAGRRRRH